MLPLARQPTARMLGAVTVLALVGAADVVRVAGSLGRQDLLLVGLGALPVALFAVVAMRQGE